MVAARAVGAGQHPLRAVSAAQVVVLCVSSGLCAIARVCAAVAVVPPLVQWIIEVLGARTFLRGQEVNVSLTACGCGVVESGASVSLGGSEFLWLTRRRYRAPRCVLVGLW